MSKRWREVGMDETNKEGGRKEKWVIYTFVNVQRIGETHFRDWSVPPTFRVTSRISFTG